MKIVKSLATYIVLPVLLILGVIWFIDFVGHIEPIEVSPINGTFLFCFGGAVLFWLITAFIAWPVKYESEAGKALGQLMGGIFFIAGWLCVLLFGLAITVGGCEWLPWTEAVCTNWK